MAYFEELPVGKLIRTGDGSTVSVLELDNNGNITECRCIAVNIPSAVAGYAIGCKLIATDTGAFYTNTGTASSCTFTSEASLSAATSAGKSAGASAGASVSSSAGVSGSVSAGISAATSAFTSAAASLSTNISIAESIASSAAVSLSTLLSVANSKISSL